MCLSCASDELDVCHFYPVTGVQMLVSGALSVLSSTISLVNLQNSCAIQLLESSYLQLL